MMINKKVSLAFLAMIAFQFVACSDDSSNSYEDFENFDGSCKFLSSDKSFTEDFGLYKISYSLTKDGYLTISEEYSSSVGYDSYIKEACNDAKKESSDDVEISCSGSKLIMTDKTKKYSTKDFESLKKASKAGCEAGKNGEIDLGDIWDDEDDDNDEKINPAKENDGDNSELKDDDKDNDKKSSKDDEKIEDDTKPGKDKDVEPTGPKCTGDNDGEVFMDGMDMSYCEKGKMVNGIPKCDEKNEGKKFIMEGISVICTDGEFEPEGMVECTEENEGEKFEVAGVAMICKDGESEFDLGLPECTSKNEGDFEIVKMAAAGVDVTLTYACEDGEWVEDPECTEKLEGKVKETSAMGFTIKETCVDGEWEMLF